MGYVAALNKNPIWKKLPAVKEGRAHAFPARVWGAAWPALLRAGDRRVRRRTRQEVSTVRTAAPEAGPLPGAKRGSGPAGAAVLALLLALTVLVGLWHLTQGTSGVGVGDLLRHLAGERDSGGGAPVGEILTGSRLPRLFAGVAVGFALGCSRHAAPVRHPQHARLAGHPRGHGRGLLHPHARRRLRPRRPAVGLGRRRLHAAASSRRHSYCSSRAVPRAPRAPASSSPVPRPRWPWTRRPGCSSSCSTRTRPGSSPGGAARWRS